MFTNFLQFVEEITTDRPNLVIAFGNLDGDEHSRKIGLEPQQAKPTHVNLQ
ncbi:MAG: hypothetical protein JO150_01610 [Acidobacteriaceae bacterium]|nr:hypothetical protein [Acidobacteriaceae bacterium]